MKDEAPEASFAVFFYGIWRKRLTLSSQSRDIEAASASWGDVAKF